MSTSTRLEGVCFVREWSNTRGQVTFWCPGCNAGHTIQYGTDQDWTWNRSTSAPTFTPSVLAFPHGKFIDETLEGDALMDESNKTTTPRCHSFVTDGRIQYLADSEHELANQTVPLGPLPTRYTKFLRA